MDEIEARQQPRPNQHGRACSTSLRTGLAELPKMLELGEGELAAPKQDNMPPKTVEACLAA